MRPGDRKRGGGAENDKSFQKRKLPPPLRTDLEAGFWQESKRRGTSVMFSLRGGEKLRGAVTEADDGTVRIRSDAGREIIVSKADIRYIEEG